MWDTSGDLLYAIDNDPRFYLSTDWGRTWHPGGARIPYKERPHISHVCSLTSFVERGRRDFYITTSFPGQIFRTVDTGRHWVRVFSDSSYRLREIPELGKLTDGRFFAVSAKGIIDAPGSVLIGSQNSKHWKIVPAPEGLWGFGELPSRSGFIVAGGFSLGKNAGDAALFVTQNFGHSWAAKQVLGAALVWQVEFAYPHSWLLATDKGLLELNIHSFN